ncbi:hypothetical protein ACFXHK_38570, partial [Embleya sp. NPDC059267]
VPDTEENAAVSAEPASRPDPVEEAAPKVDADRPAGADASAADRAPDAAVTRVSSVAPDDEPMHVNGSAAAGDEVTRDGEPDEKK